MKQFIVIDEYLNGASVAEAESMDEAVQQVAKDLGIEKCLSQKLIPQNHLSEDKVQLKNVVGAKFFFDEVTAEGWGPGCKFEGKHPDHQVMFTIFEYR